MFDIAMQVQSSLKSTVLLLGQATRKDDGTVDRMVLGFGVAIVDDVVLTSIHVNQVSKDVYSKVDVFVGSDDKYDPTQDVTVHAVAGRIEGAARWCNRAT